ncbi:hypothetical protein HYH02_011137 [Chlamydomonas schloesseri]|uniref:Uncharacterized protein n=1 Tax=Chlamydomonas schloesseri TaxID=2026947 RepID=A0A835T5G8_9CHLO|nr:hypothetical protein HYH02_011137 [Chlamydomonas schloesseri]|eukprot:KAG2437761.1 hypothetical protein HYH02_011137 [Chlamydomonas schloesseri]
MNDSERAGLVSGGLSDGGQKPVKVNKLRGIICWGVFAVILVFLIIMTSVFTEPKSYKAATPVTYLTGEDVVLYNGLGPIKVLVPTTNKLNALANYQLGLQLLQLFWYDLAIQKFQTAQSMDKRLAMAYVGEALAYKQPLWQTEDVAAAQAVLARMDANIPDNYMAALSGRERAYINAVRALYANGTSLQARETTYSTLMQAVANEYQDDPDACAFAALSLLGQLNSVGGYLTPEQAQQVRYNADELLGDCTFYFPNHAGLLHYQVYLYDVDNLEEAAKGVTPGIALGKTAPVSSRAQHMRSHIYMRLGNWSQVVDSNTAAVAASDNYCTAVKGSNTCDADNRWHALEWQMYGQTQMCGVTAATTAYKRMQAVAASQNYTGDYGQWLYRMYAHLQLQSLNSVAAVGLKAASDNATAMLPPPLYMTAAIQNAGDIQDHFWPPHAEAHALLARIYSLVAGRTLTQINSAAANATIAAAQARIDAIVARQNDLTAAAANGTLAVAAAGSAANAEMTALLTTVQLQARALVAAYSCVGGDSSKCGVWRPLMDQALALHNNFSSSSTLPSLKIAPTPEFYGNLLVATLPVASDPFEQATTASRMFSVCLQQLPGRMQCVLGSARAAKALGNTDMAKSWYSQLAAQCRAGDARFPALVEAKANTAPSPPPPKKSSGKGLRRALASSASA